MGEVAGLGNPHSQLCCSASHHTFFPHYPWCLTRNRDGVHKRDKVNWVGPVFDPNYILMKLGHPGQPNPLSSHSHHISPPQPHDPSFQNRNGLPQPQSAWPSPVFPLQGPACLLCPLCCLSTKELKTTPNHDNRGGGRGLTFLEPVLYPCFPQANTGWAVSPGHSGSQVRTAVVPEALPAPPWNSCSSQRRGRSCLAAAAHFKMRALQKLLEISMSILGSTNKCSMKLTVDLPPFHE